MFCYVREPNLFTSQKLILRTNLIKLVRSQLGAWWPRVERVLCDVTAHGQMNLIVLEHVRESTGITFGHFDKS